MTDVLAVALFVVGYPVSITVIARWLVVLRERRLGWLVAHELAVAAIVIGWVIRGLWPAVVVNAAWLAVAAVWYAVVGRRRAS